MYMYNNYLNILDNTIVGGGNNFLCTCVSFPE